MSKMNHHLLCQKVCKRISVMKTKHTMFSENWHFSLRFVLMTTKTPVFYFITEILCQTFWRNKWRSIFDVVKNLCLCDFICNSCSSSVTIFKDKYFSFMNLQVFCLVLSFLVSLFFKSLRDHSSITSSCFWLFKAHPPTSLMVYSTVNHQKLPFSDLTHPLLWWRNT